MGVMGALGGGGAWSRRAEVAVAEMGRKWANWSRFLAQFRGFVSFRGELNVFSLF